MYAFISKSLGSGIRVGIGKRLGQTRRVCHGFWCQYKIRILTLGSVTIIIATSLPPRAGAAFIAFTVTLLIGLLATRARAPEPVVTDERMTAALHPRHGEK